MATVPFEAAISASRRSPSPPSESDDELSSAKVMVGRRTPSGSGFAPLPQRVPVGACEPVGWPLASVDVRRPPVLLLPEERSEGDSFDPCD